MKLLYLHIYLKLASAPNILISQINRMKKDSLSALLKLEYVYSSINKTCTHSRTYVGSQRFPQLHSSWSEIDQIRLQRVCRCFFSVFCLLITFLCESSHSVKQRLHVMSFVSMCLHLTLCFFLKISSIQLVLRRP